MKKRNERGGRGQEERTKLGLFQIKSENCHDSGVVMDAVLFLQCS